MTLADRYQFLLWWEPRYWGFHLYRYTGSLWFCYRWSLVIGPLEVRAWR